jgi:hypothetical protein
LIHEVPDKVLRYIGGGGENLGEAANEQQSRGIFVGGAAKAVDGTTRHKQLMNKGGGSSGDSGSQDGQSSMGGAAASGAGKGMSKISKMLSPK